MGGRNNGEMNALSDRKKSKKEDKREEKNIKSKNIVRKKEEGRKGKLNYGKSVKYEERNN